MSNFANSNGDHTDHSLDIASLLSVSELSFNDSQTCLDVSSSKRGMMDTYHHCLKEAFGILKDFRVGGCQARAQHWARLDLAEQGI